MRWFAIALLLGTVAAQENPFVSAMQAGLDGYKKKQYEAALTQFATARQLGPARWEGHTWQALTLIQMAIGERDPRRRAALTREAEAMTVPLDKQCGLMLQHPLRNYILGMCASVRGETDRAKVILTKAYTAQRSMFKGYDGIQLLKNVERAYGRVLMDFARRYVLQGEWEAAEPLLKQAEKILPKDDPGRKELHRSFAVIDEALGRYPGAIRNLEICFKLYEGNKQLQTEFVGTIAQIHFKSEELDKGVAVLKTVPEDSKHQDIIAAWCTYQKIIALRAMPNDAAVAHAMTFFRKALETYPADERYRLVEDYVQIVLHKIGKREAQKERAALVDALNLLISEIALRPECPSLYFQAYKIYKLLGDGKKELEYENLHTLKKKEYEGKARFDARGRPRCR